jgi:DNA-binding winged helix-turn-helix (wHTH) protein
MVPNLTSTLEPDVAAGPSRPAALSSRYIRFGPFQVDQHRQEVSKGGMRLKLQGKVYQVLLALIEKQGEVVTREELRVRLWPADTHVNYDANVNTTVNKLRLALGDSSEKPLYIETIPRKGYGLVVQPEFTDVPAAAPATRSNPVNAKPETGRGSSPKTNIWVPVGIIGLILGGMLLGAAIARLWLAQHFASTPGGFWF